MCRKKCIPKALYLVVFYRKVQQTNHYYRPFCSLSDKKTLEMFVSKIRLIKWEKFDRSEIIKKKRKIAKLQNTIKIKFDTIKCLINDAELIKSLLIKKSNLVLSSLKMRLLFDV